MIKSALPEYDSPPIDEVALGIGFSPIEDFKIPHFGLYWATVRDRYPNCDVQPPSPPQIEPVAAASAFSLQFVSDPNAVRCWYLDSSGNNLIQLQPDRFLRNWRQVGDGNQVYPRYALLRPSFESEWNHFAEFLTACDLKMPRVLQCEVTYINNIDRGTAWESFSDLPKILTFWKSLPETTSLKSPESMSMSLAYPIDSEPDRLRVTVQHAIRLRDGKDILQLSLVARLKPKTDGIEGILSAFDCGHESIVRAFTDLTTTEMHKIWNRRV